MKKLKLLIGIAALLMGGGNSVNAQGLEDITDSKIVNANLSAGSSSGWTTVTNINNWNTGTSPVTAECYSDNIKRASYEITQTITLDAGSYRLEGYGFLRDGGSAKLIANVEGGTSNEVAIAVRSGQYKSEPNSMGDAAKAFKANMYKNVVEFTLASSSTVKVGFIGTHTNNTGWFIAGPVKLYKVKDEVSAIYPNDITHTIDRSYSAWTRTTEDVSAGGSYGADVFLHEVYKESAFTATDIFSKTYSGLENGAYELKVYAAASCAWNKSSVPASKPYVYAQDSKYEIDVAVRNSVPTAEEITLSNVKVFDGTLKVGLKTTAEGSNWIIFNLASVKYLGDPLKAAKDLLTVAVEKAQALVNGNTIPTAAEEALQAVIDANDNDDNAFTTEDQFNTAVENINTAYDNYQALAAPYAAFSAMKAKANGLKNQSDSYTDPGTAVSSLENAISLANSAVEAALTADAINTQIENVRKAAFAFLGNVSLIENQMIDISEFIINAGFDNEGNGWHITKSGTNNWSYSCGEFYEATFDISQTLKNLPAGKSFKLKVQAFQRPGDIADVYTAFGNSEDKTKNVNSEIYVNTKSQKIKNIVSEYSPTELFNNNTWQNDSKPADGVFVPNCMQGARKYFDTDYTSGVKFYENEVAAAANGDGDLIFGFRSTTAGSKTWTIFDNFRLYYVGDDLSGFATDLTSVISSVKTSVDGLAIGDAVKTKLKSLADSYEKTYSSADEYTEAITAVNSIETIGLRYEAVASLTKITNNVGEGIFQYNSTTNEDLWNAYSTAKGNTESYSGSTIAGFETLVVEVETAVTNYYNQALNAPAADKRYTLTIVESGKAWDGAAVTFIAGARNAQSQGGEMGGYGIQYLTPANANMNQALKFTAVAGEANTYKVSAVNAATGAEQYLTTGSIYGGNNDQIRTTDDASKAMWIKAEATTTDGQFQIRNMSANKIIANNNNNDMYTANSVNFTIAEASQATVNVTIAADVKYATRIFPFTPALPSGVKAYSCEAATDATLTLVEVAAPAANVPYILEAESGCASTDLTGWGTAGAETYTTGWLTGVYTATDAPVASYVLQNNDSKVAFYVVAEGEQPTVGANRCYLTVPTTARPAFFFGDDDTTGIEAINALTNGTAEIYNVNGVKVPALQKGMNIVKTANGKTQKILVK